MNRGGLLLLLILIITISLAARDVPQISLNERTELTGDWSYRYLQAGDQAKWQTTDLPVLLDPRDSEYPVLLLQLDFFVPSELEGKRLYLLLGKRWGPIQAYINNVEVIKSGSFYPDYHYHEARRVNAAIPDGLLQYGQNNRIFIRFGHERDRNLIEPPAVGFADDYWFYEILVNFINVDLYRYLSFFSLFVALFFLMQFAVRFKERSSLIFALVNIGMALYMIRLGYPFFDLPVIASYGVSKAFLFPSLALMTAFLAWYLNADWAKKLMPVFWATSLISFISLSFFGRTSLGVDRIFSVSLIPVVLEIALMMVITIRSYRQGNPDALPVLVGLFLGGLISFHDIVYMILRIYPNWWIQGVGVFVFDMGVFASLAIRSMRIHGELERYSEMIEQKVLDRTRELQWANQDLQVAMEAARHASQAKSRFLANISHEMRTPLNCIIGFSEMIGRNATEKQKANLEVVLQESERLLKLINQLLDIEKIEAGKISLDAAPFTLWDFVRDLTNSFAVQCAGKGLHWRVEIEEETPEQIEADAFRLRQVLDNLISNAVKFTSRGSVTLNIAVLPAESEGDTILRFSVRDTGIGIPLEQSNLIFESFEQGDSSRTRLYGGTGLGTTIAKQLVTLMNGKIGVESEVGVGSEFWFTLPCHVHEDGDSALPVPVLNNDVPGKIDGVYLILIVEDYAPNRVIARAHLESAGCRVEEAANGREAVRLVENRGFDLILMDIQMPDMDGLEATHYIRKTLGKNSVPILGLTANAFPEELKQYRDAGMDGVLIKPIRRESFLAQVAAWLAGEGALLPQPEMHMETDEGEVCDLEALTREMEGNRDQAVRLLIAFAATLESQLPRLEDALIERDWETLHREIHSIKGGALNMFADRLVDSATAAEAAAKERVLETVRQCLPQIKEEVRRFNRLVSNYSQA